MQQNALKKIDIAEKLKTYRISDIKDIDEKLVDGEELAFGYIYQNATVEELEESMGRLEARRKLGFA